MPEAGHITLDRSQLRNRTLGFRPVSGGVVYGCIDNINNDGNIARCDLGVAYVSINTARESG